MIVGVDIGGTKTYVAVFAENGKLLRESRFETDRDYNEFLNTLKKHAQNLGTKKAKIACAAVPGLLDRKRGVVLSLGNLPWKDKYIRHDISEAIGVEKIYIENDSKLAGLSEARFLLNKYSRVYYLTISTGIGGAFAVNGKLVKELTDMEIGKTPLEFAGSVQQWEEFASGRAFFEKYGKKSVDVNSEKIWQEFTKGINAGLGMVCSGYQPEAIVFGGGLGQRVNRFKLYLESYLEEMLHPIVRKPALLASHYRSQSVIYGCYEHAKDHIT